VSAIEWMASAKIADELVIKKTTNLMIAINKLAPNANIIIGIESLFFFI
jgi:hypothetical protein